MMRRKRSPEFFFFFLVNEDINPRVVREGMVCEMCVNDEVAWWRGAEELI